MSDYLELVDWTGRQLRSDKCGAIEKNSPPILSRLGIKAESWFTLSSQFEGRFGHVVGTLQHHR
ncbi:MAG: hypothetical protein AB9Q22_10460 [Candidatus Reddybacter sp.]